MNPIELLQKHCKFDDEKTVYVIMSIARKKNNKALTNSGEIVFREVIKGPNDIIRKYNKIKASAADYKDPEGNKYGFYIYITLNGRDVIKGYFTLMNHFNIWMQERLCGVDNTKMFKKLGGHWISALMKLQSRAGRGKFLVDCDTKEKDKVVKLIEELSKHTKILYENPTKNGVHFVVEPFNRNLLPNLGDWFEIKTDALLFVDFIEGRETC